MSDNPFDHLEVRGDEGNLPEEIKLALKNSMADRLEFGPAGKTLALRVDGKKIYYADDEQMAPWFDDLLHFVGERGITTAFKDLAQSMGKEVASVASLPAKAAPDSAPEPAPAAGFDASSWKPEQGAPTEEQLNSRPATPLMKAARVAAILFGVLLWWLYQSWYWRQSPQTRSRIDRAARNTEKEDAQRRQDALQKAAHNYW